MECTVLVLGIGNTLLSDDGVGVHVIRALEERRGEATGPENSLETNENVRLRDAGTVGLALLPEIAAAESLIVVDATNFGGEPGDVQLFEAENMDMVLGASRLTPHEISLSDLFSAARLSQSLPMRRALVAIQPADTALGLDPTEHVAAAIPIARNAVSEIIERWLT
ncbi:MAG: hydrogenase maturation protease [Salaquimonas sp.]|jgi:hydrogenase maturation protease|nr:hydrogenase maturation protease [Salaquimonas sp.]